MKTINFLKLMSFAVLFLAVFAFSMQRTSKESSDDDCKSPQMYEYIKNFTITVKDINEIIGHQLSYSNLSNIEAAEKVLIYEIKYKGGFLSQDQTVSFETPLKATVINTQTRFTFTYKVNVTQGIRSTVHQFNGTTTLDNIKFSYTKEFIPESGIIKFSGISIAIDPNMMKSIFNPTPNANQTKKIQPAIKGTDKSLFTSFKSFLSVQQFTTFLQVNSKKQYMSKTYDSNPFKYDYYQYITNLNVSTLSITLSEGTAGNTNVMNGISAKLESPGKYCSNYVPDVNDSETLMFISTEFIQNFIDFSILNYKNWSNVQVNKQNSRSGLLQFRLLDLQYIVSGLFDYQLAPFYQNQIIFRCNALKNVESSFDMQNKVLLQGLDWQCYAYVQNVNGKQVKVMDFQPRIKHIIDFTASSYLFAGMNKLEFVDCVFNKVDDKYSVTDPRIAQKYIQSSFNDFRTPSVLGSYFRLPKNSRTVKFGQNNVGIKIL